MFCKEEHPEKAYLPIDITELAILIVSILLHA